MPSKISPASQNAWLTECPLLGAAPLQPVLQDSDISGLHALPRPRLWWYLEHGEVCREIPNTALKRGELMAHRKGNAMDVTYKKMFSSLLIRGTWVKSTRNRHVLSTKLAVIQVRVWRHTYSYIAGRIKTCFDALWKAVW